MQAGDEEQEQEQVAGSKWQEHVRDQASRYQEAAPYTGTALRAAVLVYCS